MLGKWPQSPGRDSGSALVLENSVTDQDEKPGDESMPSYLNREGRKYFIIGIYVL